eukprot:scaffold24158_cov21-Prasinocladus_malaysianus.AAC.1
MAHTSRLALPQAGQDSHLFKDPAVCQTSLQSMANRLFLDSRASRGSFHPDARGAQAMISEAAEDAFQRLEALARSVTQSDEV